MTVFLWEQLHIVPGQTNNYIRGFAERWLPLSDKYDVGKLQLSGFFVPNVLYHTQPTVHILWTIGTWENWAGWTKDQTAEELLIKTQDFYQPAMGWRAGWTDKVIQALPSSPLPPMRPGARRPGTKVIDHKFIVQPHQCETFVATFMHDVVPAAAKAGLQLELFARAVGRPTEYLAFWTIEAGEIYWGWRGSRNIASAAGILPAFEKAWSMLIDVEEHELSPTFFSPLGGSSADETKRGEGSVAI